MRVLGAVFLLVAAILFGLTHLDRQSTVALDVVELEGRLGVPLYSVAGALGVLAIAFGGKGRLLGSSQDGRRRRSAPRPRPRAVEGWLATARDRAHNLPMGEGASITLDPRRVPPLLLVLERLTPERARRAVEVYCELLATLPLPPRAGIQYRDCMRDGTPRQHHVTAALRRAIGGEGVKVVAQEDTVDIVFAEPDPCWREAALAAQGGGR